MTWLSVDSLKDFAKEYWRLLVLTTGIILLALIVSGSPDTPGNEDPAASQESTNGPGSIVSKEKRATTFGMSKRQYEVLHLTLILLIIVVEFYALNRMLKEQKERQATTEALTSFRAAMGRQNYLDQIAYAITTAKHDVVFTTATMEASWNSKQQLRIFDAVKARFDKVPKMQHSSSAVADNFNSGYRHRGVVARRPETLPGVVELLCFTGIEIRMHPVMAMSRLRFLVQDNERSVLGIAENSSRSARDSKGDSSASAEPSSVSFNLDSTMLALALRTRFDVLWKEGSDPWEYIEEFVSKVEPKDDHHTQLSVLSWLKADGRNRKAVHERLLEKCPSYKALEPIPGDEL